MGTAMHCSQVKDLLHIADVAWWFILRQQTLSAFMGVFVSSNRGTADHKQTGHTNKLNIWL